MPKVGGASKTVQNAVTFKYFLPFYFNVEFLTHFCGFFPAGKISFFALKAETKCRVMVFANFYCVNRKTFC
jgi:hypothetical protein